MTPSATPEMAHLKKRKLARTMREEKSTFLLHDEAAVDFREEVRGQMRAMEFEQSNAKYLNAFYKKVRQEVLAEVKQLALQ